MTGWRPAVINFRVEGFFSFPRGCLLFFFVVVAFVFVSVAYVLPTFRHFTLKSEWCPHYHYYFFQTFARNEGWSFLLHVCTFLCLHASSLISNQVHSSPIRLLSGVGSQVQQDIQGLPLTSDALHFLLEDWRCRIYDPPSDSWSSVTWQSGNCESLFQSFDGNYNAVRIHDGQWMHLHKKL